MLDFKYRRPGRYMISWFAVGLTIAAAAIIQPRTFNAASLELMTALAGCLLVASTGQLLIVMLGEIDSPHGPGNLFPPFPNDPE